MCVDTAGSIPRAASVILECPQWTLLERRHTNV
nr:MAG TPA: hypothetical protein [Caudoviricetes sp.]